jgi:hypothetical protein
MKCAVIPINRSDLTLESAYSSIVRTYELFDPGKFIILYAKFNEKLVFDNSPLKSLLDGLKNNGKDVILKNVANKKRRQTSPFRAGSGSGT